MLSRVVRPDTTTYTHDYQSKEGHREVTRNLSTAVTTGLNYCPTRDSLYLTDYTRTAERASYARPRSFRMELTQLPPEYASSVRPNLQPTPERTDYQHYFGVCGESATLKRTVIKPRSLSKQTRAIVDGTTRATHHPPKYDAHIPAEWLGNRGKTVHPDRTLEDITWQYHSQKTGYCGFVPSTDVTKGIAPLNRARTTYRDMCDELGYSLPD
jgi:hypothetical protein